MKRALVLMCLLAFAAAPAEATQRRMGELPAPRLLEPSDRAKLGKDGILFRWTNEGGDRNFYDFRLYKGTRTVESGLILKEQLPRGHAWIKVPAEKFESGGTYSWSVKQVGSRKSRSNYSVFTIAS